MRRVEALRENQLNSFLQNKEKLSALSAQKDEEMINDLSKQIIKLGGKPNIENEDNRQIKYENKLKRSIIRQRLVKMI